MAFTSSAESASASAAVMKSQAISSSFMNWFWDLASDDLSRRLYAGTMIVKHVQTTSAASSDHEPTLSADGEYALKRLIRGVSSSRDSARQGFSSCLCQFYKTFPFIESNKIILLIEESTKVPPPFSLPPPLILCHPSLPHFYVSQMVR
jgi:hypothetical protein